MITSSNPTTWEQLEEYVADILTKCGMTVESQKALELVRGKVNVDVYSEQDFNGRTSRFVFECKHWSNPVPKSVIHGFRTVVSDSGANFGYIISKCGFQGGAIEAVDLTNVKLLTWLEFQNEFESDYFENYFRPKIKEYVDPICTPTEPIAPIALSRRLDDKNIEQFLALKDEYEIFAHICLTQFPYMDIALGKGPLKLPLSSSYPEATAKLPPSIVEIEGYEEFLNEAKKISNDAYEKFQEVLYPLPKEDEAP